jgi:hypothetical protein
VRELAYDVARFQPAPHRTVEKLRVMVEGTRLARSRV